MNCQKTPEEAKERFTNWYSKIEKSKIREFDICVNTVKAHEDTILKYFINRSTNAGAESFNAKIKGFRSIVRGVRDKKFFLFRVLKFMVKDLILLRMILNKLCFKLLHTSTMLRRGWDDVGTIIRI